MRTILKQIKFVVVDIIFIAAAAYFIPQLVMQPNLTAAITKLLVFLNPFVVISYYVLYRNSRYDRTPKWSMNFTWAPYHSYHVVK